MTHQAKTELSPGDIIGLIALVLAFITSIVSITVSIVIGVATYRLMQESKRGEQPIFMSLRHFPYDETLGAYQL
jgi:hypothetical protein